MKNLFSIILLSFFIFLGFGSMDEENKEDKKDEEVVLYIDTDTQEGKISLGEISLLSFKEMTDKYGDPSYLYDGRSYMMGQFDQIKMKKRGTNFWCIPEFRYTPDGEFIPGRWNLIQCKSVK